jgi:hypothetical protein
VSGSLIRRTFRRDERGTAIVEMAILGSLIFGVLVHMVVVFGSDRKSVV